MAYPPSVAARWSLAHYYETPSMTCWYPKTGDPVSALMLKVTGTSSSSNSDSVEKINTLSARKESLEALCVSLFDKVKNFNESKSKSGDKIEIPDDLKSQIEEIQSLKRSPPPIAKVPGWFVPIAKVMCWLV